MSTYRDNAKKIVRNRHPQKTANPKPADIKTSFIQYVAKGNFKNIIDLIIEWHDLQIDDSDPLFVLEEILRLEDVIITDKTNQSITDAPTIIFKNIFGMEIVFTDSSNNGNFHCTIFQFRKKVISVSTDPARESLELLVADYLNAQDYL